MAFRHEVLHIRRQKQRLIDIPGAKILAHGPSLNQTRSELKSDYSDRLLGSANPLHGWIAGSKPRDSEQIRDQLRCRRGRIRAHQLLRGQDPSRVLLLTGASTAALDRIRGPAPRIINRSARDMIIVLLSGMDDRGESRRLERDPYHPEIPLEDKGAADWRP